MKGMGKYRIRRAAAAALACALICGLAGCSVEVNAVQPGKEEETAQPAEERVQPAEAAAEAETETVDQIADQTAAAEEPATYSVWDVYWDLDGVVEQTQALADSVRNVCYFAAYFDAKDEVFIPQETIDFYAETGADYQARGWNRYLSVVNDQILADGSSALKSRELVARLTESPERYEAHAEQLIALALQYGYDGLEIDYENLRADTGMWRQFMPFIEYLYGRCGEEGLLLRVVIEPSVEPKRVDWVAGPTYVLMCYNLYGDHSGPGPKADRTFLEELMEKMEAVPGKVDYALANGGFDWGEDGGVKQLTTEEAEALLAASGQTAERDDISAVKYFTYQDENGVGHEVWYADEDTFTAWTNWLGSQGNRQFSIWRLG